ncbi:hypothetical protein BB561_000348 [Smittium simulii]|uniref:Uncharacterized protein n=1 Tax=Smittium simulii TaxID=133385 RepID=A0A2T9YZF5_9FUNG|nr:hypothetical protein BB561_000348 [Smittium simulii]
MKHILYSPSDQDFLAKAASTQRSQRHTYDSEFRNTASIQNDKLIEEVEKWRASYSVWNNIIKKITNISSVFTKSLQNVVQCEDRNDFSPEDSAYSNNKEDFQNSKTIDDCAGYELKFLHDDELMLSAIFSQNFVLDENIFDTSLSIDTHQTMLEDLSGSIEKCYSLFKSVRGSLIKAKNERALLVKKLGKKEQQKLPSWLISRQFYDQEESKSYSSKKNKTASTYLPSSAGPKAPYSARESNTYNQFNYRERANTDHTYRSLLSDQSGNELHNPTHLINPENFQTCSIKSCAESIATLKLKLNNSHCETFRYQQLNSKLEALLREMQSSLNKSYTNLNKTRIENKRLTDFDAKYFNSTKNNTRDSFLKYKPSFNDSNYLNLIQSEFNYNLSSIVDKTTFVSNKNSEFIDGVQTLCHLLNNNSADIAQPDNNDMDINLSISYKTSAFPINSSSVYEIDNLFTEKKSTESHIKLNPSSIYHLPIDQSLYFTLLESYSNICNSYSLTGNIFLTIINTFTNHSKVDSPATLEFLNLLKLLELQSFKASEITSLLAQNINKAFFKRKSDSGALDFSSEYNFSFDNKNDTLRTSSNNNLLCLYNNELSSKKFSKKIESEILNLNSETAQMISIITENNFSSSLILHFKEFLNHFDYDNEENTNFQSVESRKIDEKLSVSDENSPSQEYLSNQNETILKSTFNKNKKFYENKLANEISKSCKIQSELNTVREKVEKKISDYLMIRDYQFEKILNISIRNTILVKMKQIVMDAIGGSREFLNVINTNYPKRESNSDNKLKYLWKRAKLVRYAVRLRLSLESLHYHTQTVNKLKIQVKKLHNLNK